MSTLPLRLSRTKDGPVRARRPSSGGALVGPVALLGGIAGVGAAESPLIGAGVGSLILLTFLPWTGLFAALVGLAIVNRAGYDVSGLTIRLAEGALVPFAFRAFLFTSPTLRPRWKLAEWMLVLFVALNFITSYFNAVSLKSSIVAAGVETFGVVTYLAVYTSVCSPERVRKAVRVFLALGAAGAFVGILSLLASYAGSSFGVDDRFKPLFSGVPFIKGLAYEHDLFGSTCAAVAMSFYVLRREQSRLFSRTWMGRFLAASIIGMLISQARGAWLGFAFVFVLYHTFRRRRVIALPRVVRTSLILLLVGAMGVGGFFLANHQSEGNPQSPLVSFVSSAGSQLGNALSTNSGTGAGRLRLWTKGANEVLTVSPLIGLGTYSYGQRNFRKSPFTAPYLAPAYLISFWVRTLYDTGVLGVLLILLFMLSAFWPRRELQESPGDLAPVARSLLFASLVLMGSYMITDSTLLIWPWVLFGLTRAAISQATIQARGLRSRTGVVTVGTGSSNGAGALPRTARQP